MKIIRLAFVQRNASYIQGNITKQIATNYFMGKQKPCKPKHEICKAQEEILFESEPVQPTIIIRLYNCTLFLNEFFLSRFFSLQVFNEATFYVISLIYPTGVFKGVFETYYIYHIFCFLTRVFKKIFKILFLLIFFPSGFRGE